jgi:hypothetical protein
MMAPAGAIPHTHAKNWILRRTSAARLTVIEGRPAFLLVHGREKQVVVVPQLYGRPSLWAHTRKPIARFNDSDVSRAADAKPT